MPTAAINPESESRYPPTPSHEDSLNRPEPASENTPLLLYDGATGTRPTTSGFTRRAVCIGLVIGALICPTTLYFGLQTGHITGYPLATALISKCWCPSLTIPENVVVVAVATTIAAMPMVTALVGIIPALMYLVEPEHGGTLQLSWFQLQVWSIGVCFFGPFLAMRLRQYFVVRQKLPFPLAEATVLAIQGCHAQVVNLDFRNNEQAEQTDVEANSDGTHEAEQLKSSPPGLGSGMKELVISGLISMSWVSTNWDYFDFRFDSSTDLSLLDSQTLLGHFYPGVHHWPLFGRTASEDWLWNVDVSMGLVGLGIITGPAIAYHIALGAIFGWGALSSVSRERGWAPGDIGDWGSGVRGWIVWPSLAALLADCFIKFLWMIGQALQGSVHRTESDAAIQNRDEAQNFLSSKMSSSTMIVGLALAMSICAIFVKFSIGGFMSWAQILSAVLLALPLSIVGIQAAGQTGINPVSALGTLLAAAGDAHQERS